MQQFFENVEAIERFLSNLRDLICPLCGSRETFVRHGFIWGAISPTEYGKRGWRICCDRDSPRGKGCGHAPSVRLSKTLPRRCFSALTLGKFIMALRRGQSIRAAWKHSGIGLSLRTAYRLYKRLNRCQSIWRTHLHSRAPPPRRKGAGSPLIEVFDHLKEAFGDVSAIRAYQEDLQRDFLAIA